MLRARSAEFHHQYIGDEIGGLSTRDLRIPNLGKVGGSLWLLLASGGLESNVMVIGNLVF